MQKDIQRTRACTGTDLVLVGGPDIGQQRNEQHTHHFHEREESPSRAPPTVEMWLVFGHTYPCDNNAQVSDAKMMPQVAPLSHSLFGVGEAEWQPLRLNCVAMGLIPHSRIRTAACLALVATAVCAAAQSQNQKPAQTQNQNHSQKLEDQSRADQKPMVLKPDLAGMHRNHRLILKDGSYQMVTQYMIIGNRVRYFSQERGDWEELPENMVDWAATRKWEQQHNPLAGEETSPAMKEAAALDAEETAEREDQKASMPEVAKGLNLPDQDGVFALDTYHGTPELVELKSTDVDPDARVRHGVAMLNPMAGARHRLRLDGEHAKVHLHVSQPTFFISLDTPHTADAKEPVLSNAITVKTVSDEAIKGRIYGAHSASSHFAIAYLSQRIAMRFLGPIEVSRTGSVIGNPIVIPTKVKVMPGGRWLRIEPERPMLIGEYALVEILSPTEMNPTVWSFELNPATPDNPGSLAPILDDSDSQ